MIYLVIFSCSEPEQMATFPQRTEWTALPAAVMPIEATEEEKKIIDKINADALAELNAVKAKVAQEADAARDALLKEVDAFANDIGAKILGRAV